MGNNSGISTNGDECRHLWFAWRAADAPQRHGAFPGRAAFDLVTRSRCVARAANRSHLTRCSIKSASVISRLKLVEFVVVVPTHRRPPSAGRNYTCIRVPVPTRRRRSITLSGSEMPFCKHTGTHPYPVGILLTRNSLAQGHRLDTDKHGTQDYSNGSWAKTIRTATHRSRGSSRRASRDFDSSRLCRRIAR